MESTTQNHLQHRFGSITVKTPKPDSDNAIVYVVDVSHEINENEQTKPSTTYDKIRDTCYCYSLVTASCTDRRWRYKPNYPLTKIPNEIRPSVL